MQSAIQALSRISKHSPPQIGFAAAEVKITYAENAGMSTQLYEVDVFMFFLKDLEAVTTNFYHDLWQSTRMHTPKVCNALCSLLCPHSLQPFKHAQCLHTPWTSATRSHQQHHGNALDFSHETSEVAL